MIHSAYAIDFPNNESHYTGPKFNNWDGCMRDSPLKCTYSYTYLTNEEPYFLGHRERGIYFIMSQMKSSD
jgi:hypothetical protein